MLIACWVKPYNTMNHFGEFYEIVNFLAAGAKGQKWPLHTRFPQPNLNHTHTEVCGSQLRL